MKKLYVATVLVFLTAISWVVILNGSNNDVSLAGGVGERLNLDSEGVLCQRGIYENCFNFKIEVFGIDESVEQTYKALSSNIRNSGLSYADESINRFFENPEQFLEEGSFVGEIESTTRDDRAYVAVGLMSGETFGNRNFLTGNGRTVFVSIYKYDDQRSESDNNDAASISGLIDDSTIIEGVVSAARDEYVNGLVFIAEATEKVNP